MRRSGSLEAGHTNRVAVEIAGIRNPIRAGWKAVAAEGTRSRISRYKHAGEPLVTSE